MKFTPTHELPEVILVEPKIFGDARGFFVETWHARKYAAGGIDVTFVQDNHSKSSRGVLRGLHLQLEQPQGKLVRVLEGEIWDVAVDVRVGSPTFGHWTAATLSAENFHQLWVPPRYAHGFCVVSDTAEVEYKCTDFYHPSSELTVLWNDPALGIRWPIAAPVLSEKDRDGLTLDLARARLPRF